MNSSPDAETSKNFDMSYALSLSKKSEFIDYVNGFGFKFDESMNLKNLRTYLRPKLKCE